ncbi:apoptotic protease-activating factor 1-like isoform X2 [Daktulosphaira vitifoliae]|uniref:apoptotic protease-activating factor 1-like isoform X2 n=1 Tax=Daktulosphaira vitifoliae TaxID=58002 RepID=UPI0021A9E036|nr:apoptotic protease-activating factor 1-like isoform X2 [Daktulosphaira vitifoliae]
MEIDTKCVYDLLKTHREPIIQDIQGDVITFLYEKNVLSDDDFQAIKSLENPKQEACKLLDLLPYKGSYGINQFIDYLSSEYSWIADPIKKTIFNEYNDVYAKKIRNALVIGEVPQLSLKHVTRTELVNNLKYHLKNLVNGKFIVVSGMTGCGKSSLVVEILQDPLITIELFEGHVQWINVGRGNSVDVGSVQSELFNRLQNQNQPLAPPLTTEYEEIKKIIQKKWKSTMSKGLLILDDVSDPIIIRYMDINCKMLITTNDEGVMDEVEDSRIQFVRIGEGFQKEESLKLFSKCLDIDINLLPPQASLIHKLCKGFPLTISLIGAQLEAHKEDSKQNKDRWLFYLQKFSKKDKNTIADTFKHNRRSFHKLKSLDKAIDLSINDLPDDLQKYFQDFVLFVYDVNIKPEVLSILWNLNKIQVEDIMLEFIRKSLVVRVWIQPLNSYTYSVHDLILNNLKNKIDNENEKSLHRKLIECYKIYCKGNFAQLPKNDNYIFLYFGYHLKKAELFDEFAKWFLNLKFLESKIHVAGPADLLADLKKYKKYIFTKKLYDQYFDEMESFIKRVGPHVYRTKCDIIQIGLQEPEQSFIYKKSLEIAKLNGKLYFYSIIQTSLDFEPKPKMFVAPEEIQTVIFGNKHDEIIIGCKNGCIKVWNAITNQLLYTYYGHTQKVTNLVKNKLKDRLLSSSDDLTIKVWNIVDFPLENSITRTPSPETKQDHWKSAFNESSSIRQSNISDCIVTLKGHTAPIKCAQFSSSGKFIVSSSLDKTLKIWKLDDGILHKTITQYGVINWCWFMECATKDHIVYSANNPTGSAIYITHWPYEENKGMYYTKEKILSFYPLLEKEDDTVLIMTAKNVGLYKLKSDKTCPQLKECPQPIGFQEYILSSISEGNDGKTKNSRFIALALSNSTIKICNLMTGYNVLDLNEPIQGILNMDWFWSDTVHWLLCATDDRSVRLWSLDDITKTLCNFNSNTVVTSVNHLDFCKNEKLTLENYKLSLTFKQQETFCCKLNPNFDAVWLDNNSVLIAAVTKCGRLKILYEGLDQWSLIDNKVSTLCIAYSKPTVDELIVIVACEDLSMHILKHKTSEHLFNTENKVDRIYACFNSDNITLAMLLLALEIKNGDSYQVIEVWNMHHKFKIYIRNFIDCFVFADSIIIIFNYHEIQIIDMINGILSKSEINGCMKINGSLMLDHSTLAVTDNGSLKIFKIIDLEICAMVEQYSLPFNNNELTTISISHDGNFIAVGGQTCIFMIDRVLKTSKQFYSNSNMNYVRTMMWSSSDHLLSTKEDDQIVVYEVKSCNKIASFRIVADKFIVDSNLRTFLTINAGGHLVVLKLLNNQSSSNYM